MRKNNGERRSERGAREPGSQGTTESRTQAQSRAKDPRAHGAKKLTISFQTQAEQGMISGHHEMIPL